MPAAASMPATSSPPSPGTKPRSRPATREAARCSTLKAFQPASLPWPAASAILAAVASTAAPSGRAAAAGADDHHRMLGVAQRARQSCACRRPPPSASAGRRPGTRRGRSGRPARRSGRRRAPPWRQRLRMRALSTAASRRGLVPTSRMASACSMPSMVGIEQIARAAEPRIELGAVLPAIEVARAEAARAGRRARTSPRRRRDRRRWRRSAPAWRLSAWPPRGQGLVPARRLQPAVLADVGPVEALGAQAVGHEARLVGDPLLVHGVVVARQDAQHLAPARIDADVRADRIHTSIDLGLAQLPGRDR